MPHVSSVFVLLCVNGVVVSQLARFAHDKREGWLVGRAAASQVEAEARVEGGFLGHNPGCNAGNLINCAATIVDDLTTTRSAIQTSSQIPLHWDLVRHVLDLLGVHALHHR